MAEERTNAARDVVADLDGLVAPLEKLIAWLAPDGRRETILALFDNRTTWNTIRDWRRGKRHVPQWAIDALTARGAMIEATARQLKTGPGQSAGWRNVKGYQLNMRR